MRRLTLCGAGLCALLFAPLPADSAMAASVAVRGAPIETVELCGKARRVSVAPLGARLSVRVRGSRRRTTVVERCRNGRWVEPVRALRTDAAGDFRVRPRAGGAPAYVRVGVGEIVLMPVTFDVRNVNRSSVPCSPEPDGRPYEIHGTITGPRAVLGRSSPNVTLYYHGLSYGEWFWRFDAVPGLNYAAEQAAAGHVSVTVDRLGYDASAGPDGSLVCYGSQADVADQMVAALRAGDYAMGSSTEDPVRFAKVALAGHSAGGFIAEMTAYSFDEVNALLVFGYADLGASPLVTRTALDASAQCLDGGEDREGAGTQSHYALFGRTDADFRAGHFPAGVDPAVFDAAKRLRNRDPCGDLQSIPTSLAGNLLLTPSIDVPVLVVLGSQDAYFPPPAASFQRSRYDANPDVTTVELDGATHALTLGPTAPQFRAVVSRWLAARGF